MLCWLDHGFPLFSIFPRIGFLVHRGLGGRQNHRLRVLPPYYLERLEQELIAINPRYRKRRDPMSTLFTGGTHYIAADGRRYVTPVAQMPLPRRAYRVRDLVFMLGLAKSTVHDLIARGELRAVRVGRGRRRLCLIPAEEVERFLALPQPKTDFERYLEAALPGRATQQPSNASNDRDGLEASR